MVGADRELAVPPVDQHGEPDRRGPAEVVHRVQGGPDGAAGEEHVVDEHHDLAVDAAGRHLRVVRTAGGVPAQVVAVHRHVEGADRHLGALDGRDALGDPAGEVDAAGGDAEQDQASAPLLRSRISWEMRVRAREMSRASRTVRPSGVRPPSGVSGRVAAGVGTAMS